MRGLHHVELWVADLASAARSWGWLLRELGYEPGTTWPAGFTWRAGETYLVFEQSPALTAETHDRCRPGMNHLAFHAGSRAQLDALVAESGQHGWKLLFADRHPYAGGLQHYAAYLVDKQGFEVELVAASA